MKKDRNYEHQSTLIFLLLFLPDTLLSSSTLTFTFLVQIKTRVKKMLFFVSVFVLVFFPLKSVFTTAFTMQVGENLEAPGVEMLLP